MYELIHGDCLEVMRGMDDESIDLAITSPPYNLRNTTGGYMTQKQDSDRDNLALRNGYDGYDDCMSHQDYVSWQRDCLFEMMRLLTDDGAIFYNHKWRVQGGLLQDRADVVGGFPVRQIIIWHKGSSLNMNPHYFTPSYEVIYMIAKPDFRLNERRIADDVWHFPGEHNNPHPAPFPVALPERIIRATDAQVILDPFIGSGTTAVAALRAGRSCIGIDLSEKYLEQARERLGHVTPMML